MTTPIDPERLLEYVQAPRASDDLKTYFLSDEFTGGLFERYAGGGDRADVADRFTADDIVAVSFLGIRLSGHAARGVLIEKADALASCLERIPLRLEIWDATDGVIGPSSSAWKAWDLLVDIQGFNWVTAAKLLARKRPRLLPVYDRVVRRALDRKSETPFWTPLRDVLRDNEEVVAALSTLRDQVGGLDDVSSLRILDVAIWMAEHGRPEPVHDPES